MNEEDEIVIDHGDIEETPEKKEETIVDTPSPKGEDHGIRIEEDEIILDEDGDGDKTPPIVEDTTTEEIVIEHEDDHTDEGIPTPETDHPIVIETPDEVTSPTVEEETPPVVSTPMETEEIAIEDLPTRPHLPDMGEIEISSESPSVRYFYNPYEGNFVIEGIHEILATYIPVTPEEYNNYIYKLGEDYHLYIKDGKLTTSEEPRPSPIHEWNGTRWVASKFEWFQHRKSEIIEQLDEYTDNFIKEHIEFKYPDNQYERETLIAINTEIKDWSLDNKLDTPMTRVFCEAMNVPLEQFLIQKAHEIQQRQLRMTKVIAMKMKEMVTINSVLNVEEFDHITFNFEEILA